MAGSRERTDSAAGGTDDVLTHTVGTCPPIPTGYSPFRDDRLRKLRSAPPPKRSIEERLASLFAAPDWEALSKLRV